MWHSFLHLLGQAFSLSLGYMGTSALAVIAGLAFFILKEIRTYRKKEWEALRSHWAGDAGFGFLLTAGLWSCLFAWCLAKAVYQDHEGLIARLNKVSQAPISESNVDATRTQVIRSGLADLISRGVTIRDRAMSNQLDPVVVSDWQKWRSEAERFLAKNLDAADAEMFKSYDMEALPLTQRIIAEISDLEQIVNRQQMSVGKGYFNEPLPPKPSQTPPAQTVRPPAEQGTVPQSQLDKLIDANKHLPKGDRDRLSDALFDFSKILDQANMLWGKANQEGAELNQDWRNGSIAKDFETHRNKLREIDLSARDFAKSFPQVREKWKYYASQMNYIFGDNPDNDGPNAVINAVEEYSNYLDRWVTIQNKDQRTTLELFEPVQDQFNEGIKRFALWRQDCDRRLEQMKNSIQ